MKRILLLTLCIIFMLFAQEWVARYNGPGSLSDQAKAITVDDSGYIYVTGMSVGSGTGGDYATIKYDKDGNEIWVARYDGGFYDDACAIAMDENGDIYVTGTSCGSSYNNYDWATIKYNSSGVEEWVARYNGPKDSLDEAKAIAVDHWGNVYVTGYCDRYYNTSSGDYLTIKYNNSGVKQWEARYDGTAHEGDRAEALCIDSVGNIYITGTSREINTYADITTIKYDTNGNIEWIEKYEGTYDDYGKAIAVDNLGNIYVIGGTFNPGTRDDYITIKYNNSGVEQWVRYFGILDAATDEAHAIAVDNLGNVYITGEGANDYGYDYATVKYDSLGIEHWVAWYDGGMYERDVAVAVAVDESSNVYVTGYSYGSNSNNDYATIKYNSSGMEQWIARYNGSANSGDCATAIALDESSNVYVTGYSADSGTNYDYATLKYLPAGPGVKESSLVYEIRGLTFEIYPNPFTNAINIRCQIPSRNQKEDFSLKLYDVNGQIVKDFSSGITSGVLTPTSTLVWCGTDDNGYSLSQGVYFLVLKVEDDVLVKKICKVK
jgi:uncharacterized delta-60 repeat protein